MDELATIPGKVVEQPRVEEHAGPWRLFWRRLRRQRIAMIGGIILIVLYAMALLAGFIAPYSYERQDRDRFFHPPMGLRFAHAWLAVPRYEQIAGQFQYRPIAGDTKPLRLFVRGDAYPLLGLIPTTVHLFGTGDARYPIYLCGTDQFGRDILSRLLYGSQISLSIGIIGILLSFSIGMTVGAAAGYFGGTVDNVIMRICELIMSVPGL